MIPNGRYMKNAMLLLFIGVLAGCGGTGNQRTEPFDPDALFTAEQASNAGGSIWDAFGGTNADQTVNVNRYLWAASLDVLSFLPIQSVDPFTGVIITGYGVPPGGGRSYRANIHISDPALDARSLKVSLQTKSGPVSQSTARAVEDAILARARQIRIGDSKL